MYEVIRYKQGGKERTVRFEKSKKEVRFVDIPVMSKSYRRNIFNIIYFERNEEL